MVSKLSNQGHEIAVHSITHRTPGICKQTADELQTKMLAKKNILIHSGPEYLKKSGQKTCEIK